MTISGSQMAEFHRIFLGDEQGVIRVLDLKSPEPFTSESIHSTIQFDEVDPEKAIEALAGFTAFDLSFLCIGRRNGSLQICSAQDLRVLCQTSGDQLNTHCADILPWNQSTTNQEVPKLVSTWNSGEIKIQKFRKSFVRSVQNRSNDEIEASKLKTVLNIKAALQISTSDLCFENSSIAFGGDGVNLSVLDLASQDVLFKSKEPRNPYGLSKRNWISACCFIPHSNGQILFNGTAEQELCLYDIRSNKRPVFVLESWRDARVTSVLPENNGHDIWVSNAMGFVDRFDLRTRCIRGALRGQVGGSVRDLELFKMESDSDYLASVGLDRMLRIYETKSRKVRFKQYCKFELNRIKILKMKILSKEGDEKQEMEVSKNRKRKLDNQKV